MRTISIILLLSLCLGLNAQKECAKVYFYRHTGGFLQSEASLKLIQDGEILATVQRGDRYLATICSPGQYEFIVKTDYDALFQNKETIEVELGETYYLKIDMLASVEAPKISLKKRKDGEKDLSKGGKFRGGISEIRVMQHSNEMVEQNTENNTTKKEENSPQSKESSEIKNNNLSQPSERSNSNLISIILDESVQEYKSKTNYDGFEKFFIFNGKLHNSETDQMVSERVEQGKAFRISKERFAIITNFQDYRHRVQIFDSKGKKQTTYDLEGYISPDCSYIITLKDADIWRSELDILTGSSSGLRRLTELGLFSRNLYHQHWYKDLIVFRPQGGPHTKGTQYLINTKTGEIVNLHKELELPDDIIPIEGNDGLMRSDYGLKSPNLQYSTVFMGNKSDGTPNIGIYDFESNKFLRSIKGLKFYWISNKHIILNSYTSKDLYSGFSELILSDITAGQDVLVESVDNIKGIPWPNNYDNHRPLISPCGEYILFADATIIGEKSHLVCYNLRDQSKNIVENESKSMFKDLSFGGTFYSNSWISNNELIYVKAGDILDQGTWYLDASTMEKKRLSSFLAENIIPLTGTSITYFIANNKLYKFNSNSLETEEIRLGDNIYNIKIESLNFSIPLYQP